MFSKIEFSTITPSTPTVSSGSSTEFTTGIPTTVTTPVSTSIFGWFLFCLLRNSIAINL